MPKLDEETRLRLSRANWDDLFLVLKRYAQTKARRLYWGRSDHEQLAQGETAEDVVSQAVAKVFSGERKWDWGRHPSLEEFLKGIIDSLMNSLANAIDNRVVKKLPTEPEKLEALLDKMSVSSANQHRMAPEAVLLQAEREGEILKSVSALIGDDPDLVKLWNCITQGISKPKQIAQATGLPIEDVYNLGEKLRRRLKDLNPDRKVRGRTERERG